MDHINDTAKINEKHKPHYHAELYYPLDTVPIDIKKPGKRVKGGGLGSSVDKSLTDLEILTLTDNMCKIVMYDKIHLYDDITQLFGDYDCIALLYQIKSKSYGHWVALILDRDNKVVYFFDSYGNLIDKQLLFADDTIRQLCHENHNYLSELIYESGYDVDFNNKHLQEAKQGINTCGRWVASRIIYKDLTNEEFADLFTPHNDSYSSMTWYAHIQAL